MLRLIGYGRVSTAGQANDGHGIDAQRAALQRAARNSGTWSLESFVVDAGVSGKVPPEDRPVLSDALRRISAGEADGLVVSDLDRLSRSFPSFVRLLDRARDDGWQIVCLHPGIDTTTPEGRMVAHILGTVAEYSRELIVRRTREGVAQAKADGKMIGHPRGDKERRLGDEARALRATGLSWARVAERMTELGHVGARGGSLSRTQVYRYAQDTQGG